MVADMRQPSDLPANRVSAEISYVTVSPQQARPANQHLLSILDTAR